MTRQQLEQLLDLLALYSERWDTRPATRDAIGRLRSEVEDTLDGLPSSPMKRKGGA